MNHVLMIFSLLALFLVNYPVSAQPISTSKAVPGYATIGPEAVTILQLWVAPDQIIPVHPGTMKTILGEHRIDLLFVTADRTADQDVEDARAAGVNIVLLARHISISKIKNNIRLVADATQNSERGVDWLKRFDQTLATYQEMTPVSSRIRVLVLSPEGYTQGEGALITELISLTGGINTAAEANIPEARQVSDEQIRQFAPDVILLIEWPAETAQAFRENPVYTPIPAFQNQRVYRIDPITGDPAVLVVRLDELFSLFHGGMF
jgi:ABC-type Fe3+-hydroxamate transport system substrate-binding protein